MANVEQSRAKRLDQYVVEVFPSLSRSFAARLIEDGKVKVDGVTQTKSGYKLRADDVVKIDYNPDTDQKVPEIDLEVLYEDDNCVVINKPVGVLTHSKGSFNPEATVASWLRAKVNGLIGNRAGIVHRLDRATSGVMICAKNAESLSWLQKQFSNRRTKKTYVAVVEGSLPNPEAIIDMPIERNPKHPSKFRVGAAGKPSKTYYQVTKTGKQTSLVTLKPETGRTHQLRVHMNHIGHPIVGDEFYGGKPADRLYLHALELEVTLPVSHERKVFTAPLPESFNEQVKSS